MITIKLNDTCPLDKNLSGIYSITNLKTGKRYLGSAQYLRRRFLEHTSRLRRNVHCNKHLQSAYNRDGINNFSFDIIEFVTNHKNLIACEQKWINSFRFKDELYNFCPTAGSSLGREVKEDTRKKISATKKSKKLTISEEHKEIIRKSNSSRIRTKEEIEKGAAKRNKKVCMCDSETHKVLKKFNSLIEARDFLKLRDTTGISSVLRGKTKNCAGYFWKLGK